MHLYFSAAAAFAYVLCALLPSNRQASISMVALTGLIMHGAAIGLEMIAPGAVRIGFATMLSATLWISVAAYWMENRNLPLDGLRILVMPFATIAVLLPALFPGSVITLEGQSTMFVWHIVISVLAYSSLTIAAFHAVLMALQESRLHGRSANSSRWAWLSRALDRLPALLTMEKLLFRLISIGFALLTLTVLSGVIFSEQIFGKPFRWEHKIIFALVSWAVFGLLLAGRKWQGWRGRTALGFTLTGFATLLLAYVGSRFVLEVILHRGYL